MTNVIICILATIGALATLFASIGILRMPDFYLRLSVTVKASTLGIGLLLVCASIYFSEVYVTTKAIAIIFFLVLTAPVGAHMIARTAYRSGIVRWKDTYVDEPDNEMKGSVANRELSNNDKNSDPD
ncbi:MAG TPA: monovalent cation/H(+) antiporter subunit G [Parasegetibacter sp.]|jgi:multicomponent Na+:H+ antiporter subunit G